MYKKEIKLIASALGILLLIGLGYLAYSLPRVSNILISPVTPPPPPAGDITAQGMITCLPHRDTSGPQTLECAYGLEDIEGRYYALRDIRLNYHRNTY